MSEDQRPPASEEDRIVLELLDSLAQVGGEARSGAEPGIEREYLELLGMLPEAIPAPVPPARGLERLMAGAIGTDESSVRRPAGARDARRWLLPLAATLLFATTMVTGWLVFQVREQKVRIADLSEALDQARIETGVLAESRRQVSELRSWLSLVTAPGSEFCPLRPPADPNAPASPTGQLAQVAARGTVVMHPERSDWFLRVEGLAPCPQGRKYSLWFATESGMVRGPLFEVKGPAEPLELSGAERPDGISAIMITLEGDPAPTLPTGEPVLYGDERMQVL